MKNNVVKVEENPDPPKKDTLPVEHPKFGEMPDTWKAYDFEKKKEVEQLPFQFNLGDALFTKD